MASGCCYMFLFSLCGLLLVLADRFVYSPFWLDQANTDLLEQCLPMRYDVTTKPSDIKKCRKVILKEFLDHLWWNWKQRARGRSRRLCCARYQNMWEALGERLQTRDALICWWTIHGDLTIICQEEDLLQHHGNIACVILSPVDVDVQFLYERWVGFLVAVLFLDPFSKTLFWCVLASIKQIGRQHWFRIESQIDLSMESTSWPEVYVACTYYIRYSPGFCLWRCMLQVPDVPKNRILPLIMRLASRWLVSMAAACDEYWRWAVTGSAHGEDELGQTRSSIPR